jgi:putative ABC transport system permease protein
MKRVALWILAAATPVVDRESVVGDTLERFDEIVANQGPRAARSWLWRETVRVMVGAPGHRLAARGVAPHNPDQRGSQFMASMWQDVRYALRWFGRSPGFTTIAVATLALGIGANTAMFAVVNAVMLKPLPFAEPDRLMLVHLLMPDREGGSTVDRETEWSFPKFETFESIQQEFERTALFHAREFSLTDDEAPERIHGEVVTDGYFETLGVPLSAGRTFTRDEARRAGATPVAIVSHRLWSRRYGSDPGLVGRAVRVNGAPHVVIGVAPRGFLGLNGNAELWTPLAVTDSWALNEPLGHSYTTVARRRAAVTETVAAEAVGLYGPQIDAAFRPGGGPTDGWGAKAASLEASRVDVDLRRAALVVLGAVGFVLLITCVNITNLIVTKAIARQREVSIRLALGAGRWRIARQFCVESMLLAGFGAAGALVVASALLAVASALLPDSDVFFRSAIAPGTARLMGAAGLTRVGAGMIAIDGAVVAFTAALAVAVAFLVAVLPAIQSSPLRPAEALKASHLAAGRRNGSSARTMLVAGEIALAMVLVTGAGLMLKSGLRLAGTPIGIVADRVLTVRLELPGGDYSPERGRAFYQDLIEHVRAIPGVEAAGLGSCAPVGGGCNGTSIRFLSAPQERRTGSVGIHWTTAGYFDALRVPVLEGRLFTDQDFAGRPKVVLINETAARRFWPNETPLGKRVAVGQGRFDDGAEVVGVVPDVRYRTIEAAAAPDVYLPLTQSYRAGMRLFVRSQLDTATLITSIRREVRSLDRTLPLFEIKTMTERVGDAMWRTRVASWLLSGFGVLALLLTAVGVFGVMTQMVAQRTAEIGIRVALGAQRRDVLSLVLGRAVIVTAAGLTAGLVGALSATEVLSTLLYGITPTDASTLGLVAAVLATVSLAASYFPVRRAMRVDAVTALKGD